MTIKQVIVPDVASLSISGATVQLLEALTFTDDGKHLVVKATFTEDGGLGQLKYGYFLYDIENETYSLNFNTQLLSTSRLSSSIIESLTFQGNADDYSVIASVKNADEDSASLVHLRNGEIVSQDLLADVLDADFDVVVDKQLLDDSGRYLAIQTSSSALASDSVPDTNDSPDIYLIDIETKNVSRVSMIGGAETSDPAYLQNIKVDESGVSVGFTTDAYFVSPTSIDKNSLDTSGPLGTRTDAYVWQMSVNNEGELTGNPSFTLLSVAQDGTAAGFVDSSTGIYLSQSASYFSSTSPLITPNDDNNASDTFINRDGQLTVINYSSTEAFDADTRVVGTSDNGRYVLLLSSASQISGSSGAGQLVMVDTLSSQSLVISQNAAGVTGDNETISAVITGNARQVAFTSLASNLTNELPDVWLGSLFIKTNTQVNSSPTGNVALSGLPVVGESISLNLDDIRDEDGLGDFTIEWYKDDELVSLTDTDSLIIAEGDIDKSISAIVRYTDLQDQDEIIEVPSFSIFPRQTDTLDNLLFTSKYIVFESAGDNLFEFDLDFDDISINGQATLFSGSSNVDAVKLSAGQIMDFTNVKSSIDKIYLPGTLNDFLQNGSIDTATGFMTLISTADFTYTEIKFIATNTAADELIFTDGKISSAALKDYLISGSSNISTLILDDSETYNTIDIADTTGKVKAIALDQNGENFSSFGTGVEMQVSGSAGVDKVYIHAGTNVDATNLKSSVDIVYLQGEWSDYSKELNLSGNLVLTRSVVIDESEHIESVTVSSGSISATNDLLVFADGSIRISSAVLSVKTNDESEFSALSGYDGTITTPTENLADLDLIFPQMNYEPPLFTESVSDLSSDIEHVEIKDNITLLDIGYNNTSGVEQFFEYAQDIEMYF